MIIRKVIAHDIDSIRDLYLSAFPDGENEAISDLALELHQQESNPPTLSLVAEAENALVAHVSFSPVTIEKSDQVAGFLLAPLAVRPDFQKKGIGSALVNRGIEKVTLSNPGMLLVYGDPAYYGRFGFTTEAAENYPPPFPLKYPFGWQGMPLGAHSPAKTPLAITCVPPLSKPEFW